MALRLRTCSLAVACVFVTGGIRLQSGQDTFRDSAKLTPPGEPVGERPYEMVRAARKPPHAPLVSFDSLRGWNIIGSRGAVGELVESQKQRVWESPVARLAYRGLSAESEIRITPPEPIPIPEPYSAITIWVYGNNWGWENDTTTPRVDLQLLLRDREGTERALPLEKVRWKEWWLIHRLLPAGLRDKAPLSFAGLQIKGCANKEMRELYFEDLVFFEESRKPIQFEARPKRGVDPFPGQDPGANTGPGRLPFPTREETILPPSRVAGFRTDVRPSGNRFVLRYGGSDATVEYEISSERPFFRDIRVRINGREAATAWVDGGPVFAEEPRAVELLEFGGKDGVVRGVWRASLAGAEARVEMAARIWQKSLVIDALCPAGTHELSYGSIRGVAEPELVLLPFMNYGGHHLNVLMSKARPGFFASIWMDWYRSNASEPYAVDKIEGDRVRLNGGVRYLPRTDGKRNPMFERVFVTFTPVFEETLATIPNPPAKRGKEAGTRLWQESWGPQDYRKEHERSKVLRACGIERLTQCNHEITWRDSGESFTFRTMAAPKRGGDEALQRYIAGQRALGWRSGLYSNYTDYAPVNEFWDPDMVMRRPDGELVRAWPRCYSPKALFAVEMDRKLAPAIVRKFGSNAAYTDVHTSVSPWERCDYDARVPGAGTFAATFYAYGELLLHDQDVYDNHCWSEGHHQWLYAGLTTGNYGLAYSQLRLWQHPFVPHFDLLSMHPLTVDIGVPWTAQFFTGKEGWDRPENIEKSIDQFIAATIAYGHMGWLVEEAHGMRQTCRSYYMLQQLQSRYLMERVAEVRYGTGAGYLSSSEALRDGAWKENRLHIRYANGLNIWVNGNEASRWAVAHLGSTYDVPSFGWLAIQGRDFVTGSLEAEGKRFDRVSSAEYVFLDGRGTFRQFDGIGTSGSVAVRRADAGEGLSIIAVEGVNRLVLGAGRAGLGKDDVRARISRCTAAQSLRVLAFDARGAQVGEQKLARKPGVSQTGWEIPTVPGAIRYAIEP